MFDINKCTFDMLNNVTRDNDSNIVLIHIPVGSINPAEIDSYTKSALDIIKQIESLKDYKILAMPYKNKNDIITFTKIQEQELNALGWFKESK